MEQQRNRRDRRVRGNRPHCHHLEEVQCCRCKFGVGLELSHLALCTYLPGRNAVVLADDCAIICEAYSERCYGS